MQYSFVLCTSSVERVWCYPCTTHKSTRGNEQRLPNNFGTLTLFKRGGAAASAFFEKRGRTCDNKETSFANHTFALFTSSSRAHHFSFSDHHLFFIMSSFLGENLLSVKGKIALVTGGGSGIGLMAAKGLAANGAKVYIVGRRKELLEKVSKENKDIGSLNPIEGDVSSKESLANVANSIKEGYLDILVNNAGIEGPVTLLGEKVGELTADEVSKAHLNSESFESWSKLYQINTSAVFFATMSFLPLLGKSKSANIINITSISGRVKWSQDHYAYNSSKAAANALTSMLAHELNFRSHLNIRVNAIGPGLFSSEMTADMIKKAKEDTSEPPPGTGNPAGRLGTDEEMASAILFLATNNFVTGQILYLDGGFVTAVPGGH